MTIDFRPQGFTHKELYDAIHAGPGPEASTAPAARWADLSTTLADIQNSLSREINKSVEGWKGQAADAARVSGNELARFAAGASHVAKATGAKVEEQGRYIAEARAAMPAPVGDVHLDSGPFSFLVNPIEQIANEIDKAQTKAQADQVMTTYVNKTNENLGQLTPFPQPPQVVQ